MKRLRNSFYWLVLMPKSIFQNTLRAFFQPQELENAILVAPGTRRHWLWGHLLLMVVWFGLCWFPFVTLYKIVTPQYGQDDGWVVALSGIVITYVSTMIIGFVGGGIFKKDPLFTFVCSTYWSIAMSVLAIIVFIGTSSISGIEENSSLLSLILNLIAFEIIIGAICALWITIYGRTAGLKFAFCISAILALLIVPIQWYYIILPYNFVPRVVYLEGGKTKHKFCLVNSITPKFGLNSDNLTLVEWQEDMQLFEINNEKRKFNLASETLTYHYGDNGNDDNENFTFRIRIKDDVHNATYKGIKSRC